MQTLLSRNPLQKMDGKGFIKRDFAAERELNSRMRNSGVINFDLDDFISDDENEEQKCQQQNASDNNQNKSKLSKIKEFVVKNPYLKEIMKETKHFISKKSASLKEFFNFVTMNPLKDTQAQTQEESGQNGNQSGNQSKHNQQNGSSTFNQPQQQSKNSSGNSQSSSSNADEVQPAPFARSDSSICSNTNKFSQNDSLSISSHVHQFINKAKNEIREKEERRINSLNLSFRSASNYYRHSTMSVQSEALQNKRHHKLMESIMLQNSKKLKTSEEELRKLPLNMQQSIRFTNINAQLEKHDIEQDNYLHKNQKLPIFKKSYSTIVTSNLHSNLKASSETDIPDTATIRPNRSRHQTVCNNLSNKQQDESNLTQEEREEQERKQRKLEIEAQKFVQNKISSKNKFRVQLKRILLMKKEARKLNIDYSKYAEEMYNKTQLYKDQKNKQISSMQEKKKEKYEAKLSSQQMKELNRASSSNYQQFLQDPEVVLSRENSYIQYKSSGQQGETSKYSQLNNSSKQKHSLFEQESTLLVEQNSKNQKQNPTIKGKSMKNAINYSDSQSICEESDSSHSSSNSLSSSKQPKRTQAPFDDEFSMSSIQRHSDDEDSAANISFPTNNSAPISAANNTNSNTNCLLGGINGQQIAMTSSQLFKKPQEKKPTDETLSTNSVPTKNVVVPPKGKDALTEFPSESANKQTQQKPEQISLIIPQSTKQVETVPIINLVNSSEIEKKETKQGLFGNIIIKNNESEVIAEQKKVPLTEQGGLFGNLSAPTKSSSSGTLFTEVKSTPSTSLFGSAQPAASQLYSGKSTSEGQSTSLFGNLKTPLTSVSNTNESSKTESATISSDIKPTSLFGNGNISSNNELEANKKSTTTILTSIPAESSTKGLFGNIKPVEASNPIEPTIDEVKLQQKPKGLFDNIQPIDLDQKTINEVKAPEAAKQEVKSALFGNLLVPAAPAVAPENKAGGLFGNLVSNDNTTKTPEKSPAPSLFGNLAQEQKQTQNGLPRKDSEMEMGNESAGINNPFNSNNQLNNGGASSNTAQLLSTPQPTNQSSSNIGVSSINPFANNSSPVSGNPFSSSAQQNKQNKPFGLNDLIKNHSYTFNQNGSSGNSQNNNNNLFQQQNNSLFQQQAPTNPFNQNSTTNNNNANNGSQLFQSTPNNLFQQSNSNMFNSNMTSSVSNNLNPMNNGMVNNMGNGMNGNNMSNSVVNNNMSSSLNNMNSGISSFQQNNFTNNSALNNNNNSIGMTSSVNMNSNFTFNQQQNSMTNSTNNNNMYGNQNFNNNNNYFNQNNNNINNNPNGMGDGNNMFGNIQFNSYNQPATSYFNNVNMDSSITSNPFQQTSNFSANNSNTNTFIQNNSSNFNNTGNASLFGGVQQQSSLFGGSSSMTTSQSSTTNKGKKGGSNKTRIS